MRRRLPRQVVVALEHFGFRLNQTFVAHEGLLPSPYSRKTERVQRRHRVSLSVEEKGARMRFLVTAAGLFTLLVLVLPAHP